MAAEDLSNVAVAAISMVGTLAGTGSSMIMANRLISCRLTKLEELVRERAGAIERIYTLEREFAVTREAIREMDKRLAEVEQVKNK